MQVSFNPLDVDECAHVTALIAQTQGTPAPAPVAQETAPTPVPNGADVADSPAPASPTAALDAQAGVELDSNGTPWLEAVHATTKTQTVKGVWKAKRGVDKEVIAAAEAEARAKIAGTPQPTTDVQPPVPETQAPHAVATMQDVSETWTAAMNAGLVTMEGAPALYAQLGIDPAQMTVNETMRSTLVAHLKGMMQQPAPTMGIPGVPGT